MNDTHRHLSELVVWYPSYSLLSFMNKYTNATIQDALRQKLYSRSEGKGPDANTGWEKVWRSACWARLNETERAYFELRYAISENAAENGFSMYKRLNTPFQIDANFEFGGAVLSILIVDLPLAFGDTTTWIVVLGPAIPVAWAKGSVTGLRLRGGGPVDFRWDAIGMVTHVELRGRNSSLLVVNHDGELLTEL
jgi:alpha-L-fucosidase 2